MAEVGISNINRPAPLWYRRFSNAMVALVIPAASQLIEGWGLSDLKENRVLHMLIFLAALIKGIGVFLGNGQDFTAKAAACIAAVILFSSCSSSRKAAEKEHAYIQQLQRSYATDTAAPVFVTLPGGMLHVTDTTPCPDFHNAEVSSKAGVLTITKPCPSFTINVDSLVRNSLLYNSALLALRDEEITADTNKEQLLKTQGELEQARNNGRTAWALVIGLALVGGGLIVFKIFH